ncbi:ATP-dependent DNA helicase RecG [Alloscardovia criceti]|uniref:ATP-dependent DNA helicase RecG n=1 Tax=Alloscardovia criceti TaxID=356828 RepID=UPI000365E654
MVHIHAATSSVLTNKRRIGALKKLGITTLEEGLDYYPFRVTDRVPVKKIAELAVGLPAAVVGEISAVHVHSMASRFGFRVEFVLRDESRGFTRLVYFTKKKNYVSYLTARMSEGTQLAVQGVPSEFNGVTQFTHPLTCVVKDTEGRGDVESIEEAIDKLSRPRPVYHATSSISSDHIHDSIVSFLEALAGTTPLEGVAEDGEALEHIIDAEALHKEIPDVIPEAVRLDQGLMHKAEAYIAVHVPQSEQHFQQGIATLRFEEALISQMAMVLTRGENSATPAYACGDEAGMVQQLIDSLSFELTQGQQEVIAEISRDMTSGHPMSRLLQGEVGSGKTLVAVSALLRAVGSDQQAVLVAPTQVLAQQHYDTLRNMFDTAGLEDVPVILLRGGLKLAERRRALAAVASGVPCVVVATHAAFTKSFQAPHLAVVVIDEQHRFGVEQREVLRSRTNEEGMVPHMLIMTATPIPRSAAMTWFGNLDISWLTELPGGRKPIRTVLVQESDAQTMRQVFIHARNRINAGERVYVVCARIDEGEDAVDESMQNFVDSQYDAQTGELFAETKKPLHSVYEIHDRLQSLPQFEGVDIATLTGRDSEDEKNAVMRRFSSGETPVVVATTVIEVGVDVPEASCIIVFDAEHFGLSQLHQLRGRVGRGGRQSWAFMIHNAEPDSIAEQRLKAIEHSLDGAIISQADLELRGAGDVLGDSQSGLASSFKLLRVVHDADIIMQARQDAQALYDADAQLKAEPQLKGAVLDFMQDTSSYLAS